MASIDRFEDIEAWQDARALVKDVYAQTSDGPFAQDLGLRDQIRRAGVSIMTNIAEGFERGSDKDFVRFLFTAKGWAGEVRSLLYVAGDLGHLEQARAAKLIGAAESVSQRISGFIQYLQTSRPERRGASRRSKT